MYTYQLTYTQLTNFSKKIFWDGFLPSTKYDTRVQRLIGHTRQLGKFHHENPTPCRASYPRFENELDDPFDSSVQSNLTALPSLPFLVPAILETLVQSAEYGALTEVVPGEADLWCAQYSREHGGLILTGDSDLLVHDLGLNGAVSFLKDVQHAANKSEEGIQTYIYRPATIVKRLDLPESQGLRSLAFEIVKDPYITFPKLLKQAQTSDAITGHPEEFCGFLKEYVQVLPSISNNIKNYADIETVLRRLDPRISEYILQSLSFAPRDNTPKLTTGGNGTDTHIFLPFLLDSPVHTSAWETSMSVRQLAYSLINLMASGDEQIQCVFEHRKQVDKSNGRELQLTEAVSIPDSCDALLMYLMELKSKLPGLSESRIWTAWSICQDKSSLVSLFMQQFLQIEASEEPSNFTWDIVRFFAELQASQYSFRILKQILDVVVASSDLLNLPLPVQSLYAQLQFLPDLIHFPSLFDASCAVRKSGDQELMVAINHIIQTLNPPAMDIEEPVKGSKKKKKKKTKRKRDSQTVELSDTKKRPTNMFELLSTE
jgi:hypothetical protein